MTTAIATYAPITLLNTTYEPLSTNVTMQKAARLLTLGKAVVVEAVEGVFLRNWPWPVKLMLTKFVFVPYSKVYGAPRWSKRGVLLRDGYLCAYCPEKATTVDHVLPRSRGGQNDWLNTVASCYKCNNIKDAKTPEEAHMVLLRPAFEPKRLTYR